MKRLHNLEPIDIVLRDEVANARRFTLVVWVTLISCVILGFCIGFITGIWLK
jgi:ABC-type xylose transport system permease subunit